MKLKPTFLLLSTLLPVMALADESSELEYVLVTSDFEQQSLQTIPASVSIVGAEQIEARQAQHLEQILNVAANVNFATGTSRGRYVQIRGIGERSQFSEPLNPSVGFVIDDVDLSGIASVGTLFDVQQVEILKGPQSTEFGAAALAGAIKIKTTEADANQTNRFSLGLAQQNSWNVGVAYGGELTDKLFYRAAVQQYKSDGFIENIYLDRDDTNNIDELTSRFKLKYLASEDLTLDLNYQYFDIDNGYDVFSLDNDGKTRSDEPGFDTQQTHSLSLKAHWQPNWGQLTAIAAWSDSDIGYGFDEDWTYVGFHPWEYSSVDEYFRDRTTTTIDLRAQSNPGDISWVVGVFAKQSDEDLLRQYTYADSDFSSRYQPDNQAIYGEIKSQLNDKFRLTAGLRVDSFKIDYRDSNGFVESVDDQILGGKLVLDYRLNADDMLYAGIHRGYKAGGFNPDERVEDDKRIFSAEYNWNYELGYKGSFDNGAGVVRLAAFYMQRRDTQISDFDVQTSEDGRPSFIDIIDNADNGKNIGLELESHWQVSDAVALFANVGWLDASFSGYQRADGSVVVKRDQAQSPAYTFNVGTDIHFNDNWRLHIAADGKDQFYFSDGHNEQSSSFVLVNSRLVYQLSDWQFAFWAKNLFDKEYYTRGFGGFNNDPREFYEGEEPYYQLGDGRQLGVSLDYLF